MNFGHQCLITALDSVSLPFASSTTFPFFLVCWKKSLNASSVACFKQQIADTLHAMRRQQKLPIVFIMFLAVTDEIIAAAATAAVLLWNLHISRVIYLKSIFWNRSHKISCILIFTSGQLNLKQMWGKRTYDIHEADNWEGWGKERGECILSCFKSQESRIV